MQQQTSIASLIASLPPLERQKALSQFSEQERAFLAYNWGFWARPNQLEPKGCWDNWLILAGRGFGKSRTGSEWVRQIKDYCPLIALVGETAADVRDVMIEGESGILRNSPPWDKPTYIKSLRKLEWDNGAEAHCYSGEDPDQLRGPQHYAAWVDELCKMQYAQDTWDQLSFGLRLGNRPRSLITTTPRPLKVLQNIIDDPNTITVKGSTYDNASNLAPSFLRAIKRRYEGTRLGRQELNAEILTDIPNALWTREMINDCHRYEPVSMDELKRVVVGVDPSGSDGTSGDRQGIVAGAELHDGTYLLLEDNTGRRSPDGWAKATLNTYDRWQGDKIVAEKNYGGALVEHTIRTIRKSAPVKMVPATRGKAIRAAPIAALYEQGRVKHLMLDQEGRPQDFNDLEDQMCQITTKDYEGDDSPDNLDAGVWVLTELDQGNQPISYLGMV